MALRELFASQGYRNFMKRLLIIAALAVVISLVLLFVDPVKGKTVLIPSAMALALVLILKVLEIIVKHNN